MTNLPRASDPRPPANHLIWSHTLLGEFMDVSKLNSQCLHRCRWRYRLFGTALLFLIVLLAWPVHAHGGGTPQLTNEDIGPYWVSVWTSPDPVREGQMHVTVSVAEPGAEAGQQAGSPVLGASVEVTVTPRAGGFADATVQATNEQSANKLFYEADVLVPAAGDWQVQIDVQGSEGSGEAQFDLLVLPAEGIDWLLVGGVVFLSVSVLFFFYAMRANRGNNDD